MDAPSFSVPFHFHIGNWLPLGNFVGGSVQYHTDMEAATMPPQANLEPTGNPVLTENQY
jgi:hypothetical protein